MESTAAKTWMCSVAAGLGADKSPFNPYGHRHPYTAVYSLLFAPFKNKPISFAEIGVGGGASIHLWRAYFPRARIFGFDRDIGALENLRSFALEDVTAELMDVGDTSSISSALSRTGELFDIVLDDSSHLIQDQARIIRAALPKLKPGGLLIIEDIFRATPESEYEVIVGSVRAELAFASFIVTEHRNRASQGWDNDKLLVLIKR